MTPIPVIRASDPESVALAEEAVGALDVRKLNGGIHVEAAEDPETGNEETTVIFRPRDGDPFGPDAATFRAFASAFRGRLSLVQRLRIGFAVDVR